MKKLALLAIVSVVASACSSIYVTVTDNPVGSKTGTVSGTKEATVGNAAKNGGITEIGAVKYQVKGALYNITVSGN